jgi:IS5 family transposase
MLDLFCTQNTNMTKSTFFTGQPVFNQLLNLIPRSITERLTKQHNSDRYCKRYKSYDHLVTMLYASFFQCVSLREVTTGLQANAYKLQHLGLKNSPRRSTLSEANQRRSADWFRDLYHELYKKHFGIIPDSRKKKAPLFIIDSTTISLFTSIMQGAGSYKANGRKKGGVKAHMMIDAQHDIPAFIDISEAKEHDLTFLKKVHVPNGAIVVADKAYIKHSQFDEWDKRGVRWVTRQKHDAAVQIIERRIVSENLAEHGVLEDNIIFLFDPLRLNISNITKKKFASCNLCTFAKNVLQISKTTNL